jgi:ceramide glucosyltransferase
MEAVLVVIGAVLLLDVATWHRRFVRAIARAPVPHRAPARYPSITVIRPVRGCDVGAADNFRADLETSYPGDVETLFVFDDERDPAVPIARRIIAEHGASGRRGDVDLLFAGPRPPRRTGKLHAMIVGLARARGTLVAFGDSDTRPSPGLLTALVDALLASADVGATFAPVFVADAPETSGDVGYALMLDALYGPGVARAAGRAGRLPFIMGQIMVFRREALDAVGGPACADGHLVDDMHIGRCLHEAGYANVMINEPLAIRNAGTPLRSFLAIYRRWMMFGQDGIPLRCTWPLWLRGLNAWLSAALVVAALAIGSIWAGLVGLAALGANGESLIRLHARCGGGPIALRLRWFAVALFLLAPFVVATTARRSVAWRGRTYDLRGGRYQRPVGGARSSIG